MRRLDARSHMTPDLGDTRLFSDIHFAYSIKGPTGKNGTKSVDVMVPWKYLSIFWINLEITLINCKFILILTWSANCVVVSTANAS